MLVTILSFVMILGFTLLVGLSWAKIIVNPKTF